MSRNVRLAGPLALLSLAVTGVTQAGCAAQQTAPAQPLGAPPPVVLAPPPPSSAPPPVIAQDPLTQLVPSSAEWAAIVRKNALAPLRDALAADPEMRDELSRYLQSALHIDLTRVEGMVAFSKAAGTESFAVVLQIPGGVPAPSEGIAQVKGGDLMHLTRLGMWSAPLPGGVVLGDEQSVRVALALSRGELSPVGPGDPLADLAAADPRGVDLVIAVHAPSLRQPDVAAAVSSFAIVSGMVAFDQRGTITASVRGQPQQLEKLAQLRDVLKQLMNLSLTEAEGRKREATAAGRPVLDGTVAIIAYHVLQQAVREAEPKLDGDHLVARYHVPRFEGTATFVPYAGILAALAIPAFNKYVERAKTAEALTNLRAIRTGVLAWHADHHKEGKRFAFPPTTPWTPAGSCCAGPNQQCAPDPAAWSAPAWKALHFAPDEPHRFQYRFVSEGKGAKARFLAEARADLGCDGTYSMWSLAGTIGPDGALDLSEITAGERE